MTNLRHKTGNPDLIHTTDVSSCPCIGNGTSLRVVNHEEIFRLMDMMTTKELGDFIDAFEERYGLQGMVEK